MENYLKVFVGNAVYNLTNYDKVQFIDTTFIKTGNIGANLLPNWKINCNDKNNDGKLTTFIRSTKTSSPTGNSGATSAPPIGDGFLYIETSSNNHGVNVFCSFERTDIIHITSITFF